MPDDQSFELIAPEALLSKVRALRQDGCRLVQISATRLANGLELAYSFGRDLRLTNLQVQLGGDQFQIPSISSVYWCAFLYENEMHDLFNLDVSGMAVDFRGNFYKTAVKYPFGSIKPPKAVAV